MSPEERTTQPVPRSFWRPALIVFQLIAILLIPSVATLTTVKDPGSLEFGTDNPTPLGYTWSLSLFIVPMLYLAAWVFRTPGIRSQKKAFRTSLLILLPLGVLLDVFFAHTFFTFPNTRAVTGIEVPGLGGGIPIEEFVFYLTGFVFVLLLYIWADEYWMAAYNRDAHEYASALKHGGKLLQFHKESAIMALVLLVLAMVYKKVVSPSPGLPLYFAYLLGVAFVPAAGFYRATRRFINWRAFSFTMLLVLLISLIWEATLAAPYGWWGYQPESMMGIYIGAWSELPIEAVVVWLAVCFTTVIIYEVVKIWQTSGKPLMKALRGPG